MTGKERRALIDALMSGKTVEFRRASSAPTDSWRWELFKARAPGAGQALIQLVFNRPSSGGFQFRVEKPYIYVGDRKVPAPLSEAPHEGSKVYVSRPAHPDGVSEELWTEELLQALRRGLVYPGTKEGKEGAFEMTLALLGKSKRQYEDTKS